MSATGSTARRPETRDGFRIAVVCALPEERTAVEDVMARDYKDEDLPPQYGKAGPDVTAYGYGELGGQPIVLACLADVGSLGAADVVRDMRHSFHNLSIVFLVGITGGAPFKADGNLTGVRLGDVIISDSMLKGDLGKQFEDRFDTTTDFNARLPRAAAIVRALLVSIKGEGNEFRRLKKRTNVSLNEHPRLKATKYKCPGRSSDHIYASDYRHKHHRPDDCDNQVCVKYEDSACSIAGASRCADLGCKPILNTSGDDRDHADETKIHVGPYVSTDGVMKSVKHRDELVKRHNALAIEMEGPGVWGSVPTMVVKGVVDYADSHKNKVWRLYPAARAALCTKAIIELMDFGTLQAGHSTAAERLVPLAQPEPVSTMRFPPDPDYIRRGSLVDQIHEKLSMPAARVVLVGLGGAGKSQLAIDYGHRVLETSPNTSVLWIHAGSSARFELDIQNALEQMKVPGRNEPSADVFKLFRDWLRDKTNGSWLIILDNADDVAILVGSPRATKQIQDETQRALAGERCIDYLPVCNHGSLIVTTRTRFAALKIVGSNAIVDVGPMDKDHAVELMKKKLGGRYGEEEEELVKLATSLDFIPLAMAQAAAYIRERAPRCSVRQYLEKLEKNDKSRLGLLNRHEEDLRRDPEARNSIILTWEISFEYIRQIRSSAADLLSLMSFFDRQDIPEALLLDRGDDKEDEPNDNKLVGLDDSETNGESDGNDSDVDSFTAEAFEQDVAVLRSYSVITANEETFQMHRLVQLATRKWLESHGQYERWGAQFVCNLGAAFPYGEFENWPICEPLFPHAVMVLELKLSAKEAMLGQASLMINSAAYAQTKGAFVDAERMGLWASRTLKAVLGDAHQDTLTSMGNLASTYLGQGRLDEAENLQLEVLETMKNVLGEAHSVTVTMMHNLALTYWSQGRFEEAEKLQLELLKATGKVLGEAHPDTLATMDNLAITYWDQGRLEEAEKLQLEVLEMKKKVLREAHPDTLGTIDNLAATYRSQGRLEEAEKLHAEVLKTRKKVLGEAHPDTLGSMSNSSGILWDLGRRQSSLDLMARCATMSVTILGATHPHTITRIRLKEKREKEAETMGQEIISRLIGNLAQRR